MKTDDFILLKNAAIESVHEYADLSLSTLPLLHPAELEQLPAVDAETLPGSFMTLLAGGKSIVVGISAQPIILKSIAKAIIGVMDELELDNLDINDSINEMLNVVCGGIKRRLNDRIAGGITLDIPVFQQKVPDSVIKRNQDEVLISHYPINVWVMQ